MIDIENSKVGNPFPFKIFCQKVIPLAFDESMSYLELLYVLLHYIQDVLKPAINNNAEAVEELQNLYIELQNYVDNYFENLDIQTEINNKLDEMAESGQLADIITAYLQLRCIYGFDTIQEMAEADNLVDGSFMRTYGENTTYDGLGAFYKARYILNTDIIDGINIVALHNPNLVAQRIFDLNFNNLKTNVEIINSNATILLGDSYGEGYTVVDGTPQYTNGWTYHFKRILGLANDECYSYSEGGIGFADPRTRWTFRLFIIATSTH